MAQNANPTVYERAGEERMILVDDIDDNPVPFVQVLFAERPGTSFARTVHPADPASVTAPAAAAKTPPTSATAAAAAAAAAAAQEEAVAVSSWMRDDSTLGATAPALSAAAARVRKLRQLRRALIADSNSNSNSGWSCRPHSRTHAGAAMNDSNSTEGEDGEDVQIANTHAECSNSNTANAAAIGNDDDDAGADAEYPSEAAFFAPAAAADLSAPLVDYELRDPLTAEEVFEVVRHIRDPEHPLTLEQLRVVALPLITVHTHARCVDVRFTPTIPHCSMATLIGLCLRVKLLRALPGDLKVDVTITPGTHAQEDQVNRQLNDKERVAAALDNPSLFEKVARCIDDTDPFPAAVASLAADSANAPAASAGGEGEVGGIDAFAAASVRHDEVLYALLNDTALFSRSSLTSNSNYNSSSVSGAVPDGNDAAVNCVAVAGAAKGRLAAAAAARREARAAAASAAAAAVRAEAEAEAGRRRAAEAAARAGASALGAQSAAQWAILPPAMG